MVKPIAQVLMERDGMAEEEANEQVRQCREELLEMIANGNEMDAYEICQDWFGLEPDYLTELLPI